MKKLILLAAALFICTTAFSQVLNDSQIINGNHWIYDSLNTLSLETGISNFSSNTPLTAGALRMHFKEYDRESLSEAGKKVYDAAEEFLFTQKNLFPGKFFQIGLGLKLAPELCYKSNEQIDWTYNYYYNDNPLSADIDVGVSDYFSMGGNYFVGKNYIASNEAGNFTNIPLNYNQFEFVFPRFTYGSLGGIFNGWGIDLSVGKEGLQIGNTKTGSIIYNPTFETDAYVQLQVYTDDIKYTMDVVQVSPEKFLYWHQFDLRLFKKIKIGAMEGALINESFELRFLNPMMVFHSYSFWKDYSTPVEDYYYNESHCCSYMGFTIEINPVKNLRIYGLYAQNELQAPNELVGKFKAYPDSIGGQLGMELKIPSDFGGYWNAALETVYCSPYLYIKQAPEWSLYRSRRDNIIQGSPHINSWIGSPFGPDTFAVNASFGYEEAEKWSCQLGYLLCLKGDNDFNMFDEKDTAYDGSEVSSYYPYTKYMLAEEKNNQQGMDAAIADGRNMWMSGICEYKNQISIEGSYKFNKQIKLQGQFIYSFVFNAKHIENNFQQGIQTAISFEYKVF